MATNYGIYTEGNRIRLEERGERERDSSVWLGDVTTVAVMGAKIVFVRSKFTSRPLAFGAHTWERRAREGNKPRNAREKRPKHCWVTVGAVGSVGYTQTDTRSLTAGNQTHRPFLLTTLISTTWGTHTNYTTHTDDMTHPRRRQTSQCKPAEERAAEWSRERKREREREWRITGSGTTTVIGDFSSSIAEC